MTHCHTNVDTFSRIRHCIDSESKDFPSDLSGCPEDNTTATKYTQPDLSDFLDNLWPEDQGSHPTQRMDPTPKTYTVITMTMHSRTQVSISTQTDICDLPAKKTVTHNTTPKFVRDKTTQHAPILISKGISPHCVFLDEPTISNWEQESSPPAMPGLDIPSYFTEDFQLKREEKVYSLSRSIGGISLRGPPPPTHFRSSTMGSHP